VGTVGTTSTVPQASSYGSVISDYAANYPKLVELQEQYGARDLASQRKAQAEVYPEYEQIRSDLANQIQQGISGSAPDWYAQQLSDTIKSQFGRNAVFNPLGQQAYASQYQSGLMDWQNYWRNMAASFSGAQPVYQSQSQTANYTPSSALNYTSSTYAPYMSGFNSQQGIASQQGIYNAALPFMYMGGAGNLLQGAGAMWGRQPSTTYNIGR